MKFVLGNIRENIVNLSRKLGYKPISNVGGELNCVRSLAGGRYPRFHLFIKENNNEITFNLHLDQKRVSYPESTAHSGEYEGELVEREMERIKKIVEGLKLVDVKFTHKK